MWDWLTIKYSAHAPHNKTNMSASANVWLTVFGQQLNSLAQSKKLFQTLAAQTTLISRINLLLALVFHGICWQKGTYRISPDLIGVSCKLNNLPLKQIVCVWCLCFVACMCLRVYTLLCLAMESHGECDIKVQLNCSHCQTQSCKRDEDTHLVLCLCDEDEVLASDNVTCVGTVGA